MLAVVVDIKVIDLSDDIWAEFDNESFAGIERIVGDWNKLKFLLAVDLQIDFVAIQGDLISPVHLLAKVSALERSKE